MSSVDPNWPPPAEPPVHRPHPVAYVWAVLMSLVLIALLAAPFGVVWAMRSGLIGSGGVPGAPGVPGSGSGSGEGEAGLGDPYYPNAGNGGYDVAKYQIAISWDPGTGLLRGTTVISAHSTQRLESFFVDLALPVDKVLVNGQPAEVAKQGFADVKITPARAIETGSDFSVSVDYAGKPGEIKQGDVQPWLTTNQEWTAAGEPESSAWWYPANDHPSDPALMDVSVRVPDGMEAISVGRLESADSGTEAEFDTWHWIARQPMATYLNFVSIGEYELKQGTANGLPYVYAVTEQLSPENRKRAFDAMLTSASRVKTLEGMFGPYPFTELGGIVPAHKFGFGGLENQTRPIYNASSILSDFAPELLTHELAHMWYGDNVTLRQWNDIFNNEAYASWAQWGYNERTGGRSANDELNQTYDRAADNDEFWAITMIDPGRTHLFDVVYVRGPMVLQALRNVIGDEAFFRLSKQWAQAPGTRSLEDWMAAAQGATTIDLDPFFQAWIFSPSAPARTPENGFR
jgi:aminopeptidase N